MDIPTEFADALIYNDIYNCWQRRENIPMKTESKDDELYYYMNRITGRFEKMDHSKWEPANNNLSCYHKYLDDQVCICSQDDCREMFFFTHIPTGITVRLGSQCRLKMNPAERANLEKIKRDSRKDDCKSMECGNKVLDRRTTLGKEGFCSYNCLKQERDKNKSKEEIEMDEKREKERIEYEEKKRKEIIEYAEKKRKEKIEKVGTYTCNFKKHRGKTYNEIFEEDSKYLKWLYETILNLDERIVEWIEYKWNS